MSEDKEEMPEYPWYRLPEETHSQYGKFLVYANMSPGDRSYAAAERIYFKDDSKDGSQFNTLAKEKNWDERLEEYDQQNAEIARREMDLSHQREKERTARVTSSMLAEVEDFLDYFSQLPKEQRMQKWMDMDPEKWAKTIDKIEEIQGRALGDEREKKQDLADRLVSALEDSDGEEKEVIEADVEVSNE